MTSVNLSGHGDPKQYEGAVSPSLSVSITKDKIKWLIYQLNISAS